MSSSESRLARCRARCVVALRRAAVCVALPARLQEQDGAVVEVKVLARLSHAHVVKYFDSFVHDNTTLCIVMEYAPKGTQGRVSLVGAYRYARWTGDLHKRLRAQRGQPLPERQIWTWFIQVTCTERYASLLRPRARYCDRSAWACTIFTRSRSFIAISRL